MTAGALRGTGHRHPRLLLVVLLVATLVVSLVSTLGQPVVPDVAADYDLSPSVAQWTFTISMLTGVMATPVLGRLGDTRHARAALVWSVALAAFGCLLAATVQEFWVLLLGRALQGFSLGIVPLAIALARRYLPASMIRSAIATLSVTVVTGAGLGFPLTGVIADHHGYRATFWVGVVLAAPTAVAIRLVVPRSDHHESARKLPLIQAATLCSGLALLLLAATQSTTWEWWVTGTSVLVGAGLVVTWARAALRSDHPLVDLRLSAARPVLAANIAGFFLGVGMYLATTLAFHVAQAPRSEAGLGASATEAGFLILPLTIASLVANQLTRVLVRDRDPARGLAVAVAGVGACELILALHRSSLEFVGLAMAVLGAALGTAFALMPFVVLRHHPAHDTGSAMSLNIVLRQLGGTVGSVAGIGIAATVGVGTEQGYTTAFGAAAAMCLVAAALVAMVGRSSGVAIAMKDGEGPPPDWAAL